MNNIFNAAFPSLLVLLFIILKVRGDVDWPWLAVFSPYLIFLGLVTLYIVGVYLCQKIRK